MCKAIEEAWNEVKEEYGEYVKEVTREATRLEMLKNMISQKMSKESILAVGFTIEEYETAEAELLVNVQ